MRKVRKLYLAIALALAAMLVAASAAMAAVTFDPATGTGFVGKGDVQLAFNWNNAQLQTNASKVSFSYVETTTYEATCTWVTGEGTRGEKTHNVDHNKISNLFDVIAYEARTNRQITGFILKGVQSTTETGSVPVVGEACPGNPGTDGTWSAVTEIGSSSALYVDYDGNPGLPYQLQ